MKNKNTKVLVLVGCMMLLVAVVVAIRFDPQTKDIANPRSDNQGFMSIPIAETSEAARWYEFRDSRFFVVKASDGTIRTAFDKCDVCYAARRGYRQEGSDMVCNNCGLRFAIDSLGIENQTPGGCWPSYLPHTLENDNIIIRTSDLAGLVRSNELSSGVENQRSRPSNLEEVCDLETGICSIL